MSKKTNATTNYPKDSHKEFCKLCMSYNGGCPVTRSKRPSRKCSL